MNLKYVASALVGGGVVYLALAIRVPLPRGMAELEQAVTDPVPPALAETSGTRLKAKYVTGSDGSQIFDPEVLHDTQLGVDCKFHLAADDTVRCLPIVEPEGVRGDGLANFYTDAACTQGLIWLQGPPAGCTLTPPKYVHRYGPAPYCGAGPDGNSLRIFEVGALLGRPPGPLYQLNGSGQCVGTVSPTEQSWVAYALDAELPPSAFVAGTMGTGP